MAKLKLAENKSAYETAMDQIDEAWRKWHGPNGKPWQPYDGSTEPWSHQISEALDRGRYIVKLEPRLPWWRRILRRVRGL